MIILSLAKSLLEQEEKDFGNDLHSPCGFLITQSVAGTGPN